MQFARITAYVILCHNSNDYRWAERATSETGETRGAADVPLRGDGGKRGWK